MAVPGWTMNGPGWNVLPISGLFGYLDLSAYVCLWLLMVTWLAFGWHLASPWVSQGWIWLGIDVHNWKLDLADLPWLARLAIAGHDSPWLDLHGLCWIWLGYRGVTYQLSHAFEHNLCMVHTLNVLSWIARMQKPYFLIMLSALAPKLWPYIDFGSYLGNHLGFTYLDTYLDMP